MTAPAPLTRRKHEETCGYRLYGPPAACLCPPRAPAPLTLQLFVKGRVANVLNGSHRHWRKRADWARNWRRLTALAWLEAGQPRWDGPADVTFTVHGARLFDDDNLAACCKPIRDEAVARILGTDDGPTCGHRFHYAQELRPASERGVLIEVRAR